MATFMPAHIPAVGEGMLDLQDSQWAGFHAQAKAILEAPAGAPAKTMAAKGALPLPPKDLVWLLARMAHEDQEQATASIAAATLAKLPEKILLAALSQPMPALVAEQLAKLLPPNEAADQLLVVQRHLPDTALVALIPRLSTATLEVVLENQARLLRCPELIHACRAHPGISPASLDRMMDFLVRSGVILTDVAEFAEALHRLSSADLMQMVAGIELPPELGEWLEPGGVNAVDEAAAGSEELAAGHDLTTADAGEGLAAAGEEGAPEGQAGAEASTEEPESAQRISVQKMISKLSPAQKVALAMKGNREARSVLLRDTNRVVATAAIRNPRLTDQEVLGAAKNRSINDEVIRIISHSKQMSRSYGVRLALINNPKTPIAVAMRYLTGLNQVDLKALVKSKGVPNALVIAAKRMLMQQHR